ncbi:MAG: hypothetical protein EA381_06600 [Planctomycetaceae bacterium]|nr:MAG: hypothetical protein EA381_06600 [Planctomycetaceae bacterium]
MNPSRTNANAILRPLPDRPLQFVTPAATAKASASQNDAILLPRSAALPPSTPLRGVFVGSSDIIISQQTEVYRRVFVLVNREV